MTTQNADAVQQDGFIEMEYQGLNQGTIPYTNTARGGDALVYRGSAQRTQAFAHPDDVLFLEGTNKWKRAPKRAAEPVQTNVVNPNEPVTLVSLGLSKAALDGFATANITTLEQAAALSDGSLDSIPGVGESTIAKIREATA